MDKRKNNGNKGHSTKAKGLDKRKNAYRQALNDASTVDEVKEVIEKLKKMAKAEDLAAIKLYLSYYLGNPKDSIDITTGDEMIKGFNLSGMTDKELAVIIKMHERQRTDSNAE